MNKQQPWTAGRIVYGALMSLLLLGYLAVIATYSDPTTSGKTFYFPGFVWILRVITGVMAICLGKLWKDKGFRILAVFLLLKLIRVMADGSQNVFEDTVSDALLTGFWAYSACYGMARVFSREQLGKILNLIATIWILGMIISSCLGIYAAWTGNFVYTIGRGAVWGLPWQNRLFLVYFPTVSGSIVSFSVILALCGAIVAKHKYIKALFCLSIIPMMIALSLTDSRCAQVTVSAGIALMTGIFILRVLRENAQKKKRNSWYAWAVAIVVAGAVFITFVLLCMKTITVFNKVRADGLLIPRAFAEGTEVKRIVSNRGYTGDNVLTNRPMIWKATIQVLKENPLFLLWGSSIRNPMSWVNASDIMTGSVNHCHCMPLMILLEDGIPGLVLAGAILVKTIAASFRLVVKAKKKRDIIVVPFVVSILLGEIIECFTWLRAGQCPTLPFFFVALGILLITGQKKDHGTGTEIQEIPA